MRLCAHGAIYSLLMCVGIVGCGNSVGPNLAANPAPTVKIFAGTEQTISNTPKLSTNEYATTASGNVAPLRVLPLAYPFGADPAGTFWNVDIAPLVSSGFQPVPNSGATHYTSSGSLLAKIVLPDAVAASAGATDLSGNVYLANGGNVVQDGLQVFPCDFQDLNPEIDEFAPGASGSAKPIRTILIPSQYGFGICKVPSITVDSKGNLWVVEGAFASRPNFLIPAISFSILEFGPMESGTMATPLRTITIGPNDTVTTVVAGAEGDLYVLKDTSIIRYGLTGSAPTNILPGISIGAFALDSRGDIFAEVAAEGQQASIEEFQSGITVPNRVISGPNTQLGVAGLGITVVP